MTSTRVGWARRNRNVLIAVIVGVAIQLALVSAWAGAMGDPSLHEEPVGLVAAADTPAAAMTVRPADAITWRPLADAATARREVARGELAGALIVHGDRRTLLIASAGGLGESQALTKLLAAQPGGDLQVRDLHPLPAGDPRGLAVFVLVLGWVIGGYAGAMLLARAFGPRVRTLRGAAALLGWLAGYAVAAGALGVILLDPGLGMLTGHPAALIGVGALLVFAVGAFATAMVAMLGPAGLAIAVATLVILGNPASGGMVSASMLPAGWHFLAEVLPNAGGVHLARAVSYFGGHGIGDPLVVLIAYAGGSVLVIGGLAWHRRGAVPAPNRALAEDAVESVEVAVAASGAAL
ncbi:MAG TPA: hypothetical protein VHC49_23065 [Mycobacteriales bacterium]|nr:hypothetical protein [Mycobacteriales bacterium]